MAKKLKDEKKYGKLYGYGYTEKDGKYFICPAFVDRFNDVAASNKALDDLMASVSKYAEGQFKAIALQGQKLWNDISEELGLDKSKTWVFVGSENCIEEKKPE